MFNMSFFDSISNFFSNLFVPKKDTVKPLDEVDNATCEHVIVTEEKVIPQENSSVVIPSGIEEIDHSSIPLIETEVPVIDFLAPISDSNIKDSNININTHDNFIEKPVQQMLEGGIFLDHGKISVAFFDDHNHQAYFITESGDRICATTDKVFTIVPCGQLLGL